MEYDLGERIITPSNTACPPTNTSSPAFNRKTVRLAIHNFMFQTQDLIMDDCLRDLISAFPLLCDRKASQFATGSFPLLYLRLKRSTRPAVSTSFCLPVKNGWHLEQISRRISVPLVERVLKVSPQAQTTFTSMYLGWIFSFMKEPSTRIHRTTVLKNKRL